MQTKSVIFLFCHTFNKGVSARGVHKPLLEHSVIAHSALQRTCAAATSNFWPFSALKFIHIYLIANCIVVKP